MKTNLFSTGLHSYHIDPKLYDKQKIVETVKRNYNKNPDRNKWRGDSTKIHHYYKDWDNKDFEQVPLESLICLYENLFLHFVKNDLKIRQDVNFDIYCNIVNITVFKEKGEHMGIHDHIDSSFGTIFNAVHYLKVNQNSACINFINPLLYSSYIYQPIANISEKLLDDLDVDNSGFYNNYDYYPAEDELIIFPAYLKHQVKTLEKDADDYRIAVITNIAINV